MAVLSLVSAKVSRERRDDVVGPYAEALERGLPPGLQQTFLLEGEDGTLAIATVWASRTELEAMLATGEEPFARRLLREAGGEPKVAFFDVVAERR